MDAAFFLRRRTRFIRYYYRTGVAPFREIQQKIDAEESPYDVPPPFFDPEDGEPPFLEEWIEADDAAQVVGQSCVSLLADSVKLYFHALEHQLAFELDANEKKIARKKGYIVAYRAALGEILETDWSDCPARFAVIEQAVLARNTAQHGESIAFLLPSLDARTLREHPSPIFASAAGLELWRETGAEPNGFMAPRLEIRPEALWSALTEVEKLAAWIDCKIPEVMARRDAGA